MEFSSFFYFYLRMNFQVSRKSKHKPVVNSSSNLRQGIIKLIVNNTVRIVDRKISKAPATKIYTLPKHPHN